MKIIIIITRWAGGTVQVFSSPLLFLVVWPSRTELCCRFKKTDGISDDHLVLSIRTRWSILNLIWSPTLVAAWWNPPLPGRPYCYCHCHLIRSWEAQWNNVTHLLQGDQIVRVNSTDLSNATQVVFNFPSIFNYFQFLAIWCHCQSFSRTELWRCWRLWQGKSRWRWRGWSSSRWRSRSIRWRSWSTRWRSWTTRWKRRL